MNHAIIWSADSVAGPMIAIVEVGVVGVVGAPGAVGELELHAAMPPSRTGINRCSKRRGDVFIRRGIIARAPEKRAIS